jgi:TIR domain
MDLECPPCVNCSCCTGTGVDRGLRCAYACAGQEGVAVVPGQPAAFMSYVHFNDQHDDGQLTLFRERLSAEVRAQTGEEFPIFQDRSDIAWGQAWQQRIDQALDAATLLVVIITPSFFRSAACRAEAGRFAARERDLGRQDLILPVYYVSTPKLDDPVVRGDDEMARMVASRQFADWRELRFEPMDSQVVRRNMALLATRIRDTLTRPAASTPPVPWGHGRPAAGPPGLSRPARPAESAGRPVLDSAVLADFMDAASRAQAGVSPLLQRLARREVERLTCFVRQLPAGGEIAYDGEDREWLLGLTTEAQRSIDAISLAISGQGKQGFDGGLWISDLGGRYLALQREASGRNVAIRRIFVFENEDLARDEAFVKIIRMQREVGIDVRVLNYQLIPEWLQTMTFDFVVFDEEVSYETTFARTLYAGGSRPVTVRTVLASMSARVRDLENKFGQLWAAAQPQH